MKGIKILMLLAMSFVSFNSQALITLRPGESTNIILDPTLPSGGWITHAWWECDRPEISFYLPDTWGVNITATSYWEGDAVVSVTYAYSYYIGNSTTVHVGNGSLSWIVRCNGWTASVNPSSITLEVGETQDVTFSLETNGSLGNSTPEWTSENESIAQVSYISKYKARVSAVGPGSTRIKLDTKVGPAIFITVKVNSFPPTSVSFPQSEITIKKGRTITLRPILYPSGASAEFSWSSNKTNIASVDGEGVVTALNVGTATITVTTDNYLTAKCEIKVVDHFNHHRGSVSSTLSGNGTQSNPYLIKSEADLRYLADAVNSGNTFKDMYFKQQKDLSINSDLVDNKGNLNDPDNTELWIPIGTFDNPFEGYYDGCNHYIEGIYMDDEEVGETIKYMGVFACINDATICNLRVINSYYYCSNGTCLGGIISCCGPSQNVGSYINNCHFVNSQIFALKGSLGGIIASLGHKSICDKCSNWSNLTSMDGSVGGITEGGYSKKSKISNCYNNGALFSQGSYCGGIIAFSMYTDLVINSINNGEISSSYIAGGIVGSISEKLSIKNCVNLGRISASRHTGAIIGIQFEKCTGSNNYYLESACNKYYGFRDPDVTAPSGGICCTDSKMASTSVVNSLNDNRGDNDKWIQDPENNYYPILEWVPTIRDFVKSTDLPYIPVDVNNMDNKVYNLMGLPVDDGYKGIVIKNGKKYIQK